MKYPAKPDLKKKSFNQYLRYSAMGFQLVALVSFGIFAGIQADQWLGFNRPVMAMVFGLIGVLAGIYWMLKGLLNKKQ